MSDICTKVLAQQIIHSLENDLQLEVWNTAGLEMGFLVKLQVSTLARFESSSPIGSST